MAYNYAPDGSVIIEIGLDYQPFERDAQTAKKAAEDTGKAIEKSVNPDTKGLDQVATKWSSVNKETISVKDSIEKLKESQKQLNQLYKSGSIGADEYKKLKEEIESTQGALKEHASEFNRASQEYDKTAEKLNSLTLAGQELELQLDLIAHEAREMYKDFEQISSIETIDKLVDDSLAANKEFQKLSHESDKLTQEIEKYTDKLGESARAQQKHADGAADAAKKTEDFSKKVENANKVASNTKGINTMQIALGNLVAKGISLAISALKDFISTGIEYQSSLETLNVTLGQVFGPSGQAMIEEWASDSINSLGLAEGTAKNYAFQLGLIFNETRKTKEQTALMSTEVIQAARDWASFTNSSPEKMLQAVEAALSGNLRGLREYGIVITDAEISTGKYAKGLKKTDGQLTESEKIVARYRAILDKTSSAAGHFADNQDGASAQSEILKQQLISLSSAMAEEFLPQLTEFLTETNKYLSKNGDALKGLGKIIASVLDIVLLIIKAISLIPPDLLILGVAIIAIVGSINKVSTAFTSFTGAMSTTSGQIIALIAILSILLLLILSLKEGTANVAREFNNIGSAANSAANQASNAYNNAQRSTRRAATGTNYANRGWYEVAEQGDELMLTRNGKAMLLTQGGEQILNATATANVLRSMQASPVSGYPGGFGTGARRADGTYQPISDMYNEYYDYRTLNIRSIDEFKPVVDWFNNREIRATAQ